MAQVAFMKSGLFQTGIAPYLERSDHKPRQTSVIRLRRVTANWRTSLPFYEMSEVHEIRTGVGHYLERTYHCTGDLEASS